MNLSVIAPTLGEALEELKNYVRKGRDEGRRIVIFCEDRLTLVAERAVCAAVGGTFSVSVYTFARFLSQERPDDGKILSSRASAIAIRGIIEKNREKLRLFRRLSAAAAAGSIYDTIALLYSSGISAEEISAAQAGGLLSDKLHDIAVVYSEYTAFLQESGRLDRNVYLRLLPDVIRKSDKIIGADVVFLGFQAFTGTVAECVKACMRTAENTCGIFTGGAPDIYANEAPAQFEGFSRGLGGCTTVTVKSDLVAEAERIRCNLFDPRCFRAEGMSTGKVHVYEAADETDELEFIAASIKRYVLDEGERYFRISVMLPDVKASRPTISRIFTQYKIPYYLDERRALSEHPLAVFLCGYLECVAGGCPPEDVDAVISSYLFGLSQKERDIFRNYLARCACYRGGIKRVPREDICKTLGFDYVTVCAVRERFLKGLSLLGSGKMVAENWAQGVKNLAEYFCCEQLIDEVTKASEQEYPAQAQYNQRVYEGVATVIGETAELGLGALYSAREYKKLLLSGFAAAEISMIPPKYDAVFVGNIAETVNAGSDIVFAAGLTDAVPPAGSDTALLTDREITSLEKLNLKISPKITQVNMRRRETVALNLCAFKKHLYVSYPVLAGGEEKVRSEIIAYICALFTNSKGMPIAAANKKAVEASGRGLPYYCSELLPALRILAGGTLSPAVNSALYNVIKGRGYVGLAESVLKEEEGKKPIKNGRTLFAASGSISPTLLETYFSCPYLNYARQGLRLSERQEGAMRPLDTGNFVHEVLKTFAGVINDISSEEEAADSAAHIAELTLAKPEFSSLAQGAGGKVESEGLKKEAVCVCAGVYRQLAASNFRVRDVEKWYNIPLDGQVRVGGKVDRVDECGDLVRVIDYKTGSVDADPDKYYAGVKLQLPLYLLAASRGKRPAGAYYFPANIDFKDKEGGDFTLTGFMDSGEEVVKNSDKTLEEKKRSKYFDAYLNGRQLAGNLSESDFADFINYSSLIARKGAEEMFGGNITPSPYAGACDYCRMGGMCGFAVGVDADGREVDGVKCEDIAKAVRKQRGDE